MVPQQILVAIPKLGLTKAVRAAGGIAIAFLLTSGPSLGQDSAEAPPVGTKDVNPADVYVRVQQVRADIELLRQEMGRPKSNSLSIRVSGAAPREVYYQARTLFRKANRLSFELLRIRDEPPESVREDTIQPKHVMAYVDAAANLIERVKKKLGIEEASSPPPRDATKKPDDVFVQILEANRQLNLLLDQRFAPSDVYQQVTVCIGHAARLLSHFPNTTRIPEAPRRERKKLPFHVYQRLLNCHATVRAVAKESGVTMMSFEVDDETIETVEPSDVYDVASLIVSELAFLDSKLSGRQSSRRAYFPGRKFPSDVFQRAGILEAQLKELLENVQQDPSWLSPSKTPP